MSSYPDFLIDKRVIDRNIHKGIVDAKEHEKNLARLPDVQNNAELSQAETDLDDETDEDDED